MSEDNDRVAAAKAAGRRTWFWLTVRMYFGIAWDIAWRLALLALAVATVWKVWR